MIYLPKFYTGGVHNLYNTTGNRLLEKGKSLNARRQTLEEEKKTFLYFVKGAVYLIYVYGLLLRC